MSSVRFDTDNLVGKIGVILLYRLRIKNKQNNIFSAINPGAYFQHLQTQCMSLICV